MATFEFGERVSIASMRFSQLQRQLPPREELYSGIWIQLTRDARVRVKRKLNNAALRDYINLHLFNGYYIVYYKFFFLDTQECTSEMRKENQIIFGSSNPAFTFL